MAEPNRVKIALAGCGTVGSGVCEIVINRADALLARTGIQFEVVRALVSDRARKRDAPLDPDRYTDDPAALTDCGADMLVEVMGGTGRAREVVLAALAAGTPVVTANKALLAEHGSEIYAAARATGTCIAFEASCAGGLPIVGALLRGLQANRNTAVYGIFNSTCNFILTQMLRNGRSFDDAVNEAQQAGYAEADPTLDVNGTDTAHKLAILASLGLGLDIEFRRIARTGITDLTLIDLQAAEAMGYACKLIGLGRRSSPDSREVHLAVRPMLVHRDHPFAALEGTSSGVLVEGDLVGTTAYVGAGAGSLPTASAVVADMIEVATGCAQPTFAQLGIYSDRAAPAEYADGSTAQSRFLLRLPYGNSRPADDLTDTLQKTGVPIQRTEVLSSLGSLAVETAACSEHQLRNALQSVAISAGDGFTQSFLPVLEEAAS